MQECEQQTCDEGAKDVFTEIIATLRDQLLSDSCSLLPDTLSPPLISLLGYLIEDVPQKHNQARASLVFVELD